METKTHLMTMLQMLLKDLEQEAQTTRKMLACIPDDQYDWQPHPKSMSIRKLATHIAELPGWISFTLNTSELDLADNPYKVDVINNTKDLLAYFERMVEDGKAGLLNAVEDQLSEDWTLRYGDQVISTSSKADVIRMSICQTIHHRAQLGVFLRLLNIPIPGSYGPSADETF